jgi:hypothetical protein
MMHFWPAAARAIAIRYLKMSSTKTTIQDYILAKAIIPDLTKALKHGNIPPS